MLLKITVPERLGPPDDPDTLAVVEATIAQQATAWTEPTYQGTDAGQHTYTVDAQPRIPSVTTANVAPALRPARVL